VHIVVGYGAEEVREVVGRRAEFVVNTRWEATNSIYSFWLAREKVQGDFLLLNCDVLFAPEVLERLLDCPGSALAIDSDSGQGREQMKVRLEGGRVVGMAKDLPVDQAAGENLGVLKLTAPDAQVAFDLAGQLINSGGERNWVGAAITALARERTLRTVDVAGLPWVEIDFPVDLARARREVWPEIRGKAYRKRRVRRIAATAILAGLIIGTAAALPYLTRPDPPPPTEWVTLVFGELYEERVTIGEQSQNWWMLERGQIAEVVVTGPGPVRVESRLIDRPGEREPYVLEVLLNGERHDWYKLTTRPSGRATHPTWAISHKKRITLELPDGRHRLGVRLVAPTETDCLVRVRQPDVDAEVLTP
jgi:choline kinase